MIVDSEEQRQILLQALMNAPIQADYQGLVKAFPVLQATVEAVKAATIAEATDGDKRE